MNLRTSNLVFLTIILIFSIAVSFWSPDLRSLLLNRALDRSATPTAQLLAWHTPPARRGHPSQEEWIGWAQRWLHQQPCKAPCWEGITPGQTTIVQAMQQLQSLPFVDPRSVAIQQWSCGNGQVVPGSQHLAWNWVTGDQGGTADYLPPGANQPLPVGCGDAFTIERIPLDTGMADKLIIRVEPSYDTPQARLPVNRNRVKRTFGDVRSAFGEPSHVLVVSNYGAEWYTINIVYQQHGIVLFWTGRVAHAINDALPIRQIVFSSTPLQDAGAQFPAVPIQPWQSGIDTTQYCRRESGEPCT